MSLHAPDAMGRAALKAARLLSRQDDKLLAAAAEAASGTERAAALVRFFAAWPTLCRTIAELEAAAPACAREGYAQDAQRLQPIQGRAG